MRLNRYLFSMKTNELNSLIEKMVTSEIKKTIMESIEEGKKEVFHIKCDGQPVETFDTQEEAESHLDKYKQDHPGKQFIIEKDVYESDSDMIDKLDEMGQEMEENDTQNMEKKSVKVKSFAEAVLHAKENNIKKIKINGESHDVDECWKKLEEEEGECMECGDMKEQGEDDYLDSAYEDRTHIDDYEGYNDDEDMDDEDDFDDEDEEDVVDEPKKSFRPGVDLGKSFDKLKSMLDEKEECDECGKEVEAMEGFDDYVKKMGSDMKTVEKDRIVKKPETMKESTKRKVRLKESEFIDFISKMVTEAMKGEPGIPGIPGVTVTKKAQAGSKKENDQHNAEVEKKMKDYLSFDGNDNPEFPKQIGGDKMAVNNTEEEEETVEDNRGRMMVDINYDQEPSETFKKRAKDSLEGSTRLGNPKDAANSIPSKVGEKVKKDGEKLQKIKKEEPRYNKEAQPIKNLKESKFKMSSLVEEDIKKIKKLETYNKKTQ